MSQTIINGQPLYQVDLPEMTLAQWLALPVSERPKTWIRTDAEYTDIPAENVVLSDGTSVEEAINSNNYGYVTNISSYTSDKYVCPSDGYVRVYSYNADTDVQAQIYDSAETNYVEIHACRNTISARDMNAIYVKKGMKVLCAFNGQSNGVVSFFPFE